MNLTVHGFCLVHGGFPGEFLSELRDSLFREDRAGERCLLDHPPVAEASLVVKRELSAAGQISPHAVAIQAIAFNKTPAKNWKVAWHQDLMFPFFNRVTAEGFDLPTVKDHIHYARPPESVLNELLAVRLHLDDCDEANGPLRLSPGSHRYGILNTDGISDIVARHGQTSAIAKAGDLLLMRPLTLHASSPATAPNHRRVLHFVYHSGSPIPECWHRAI